MEEQLSFEEQQQPQTLKVLCVLTFIFSGLAGFFSLLGMLFARPLFAKIRESYALLESNPDMSEKQLAQVQKFLSLGEGTFIILCGVYLLLIGLSFFGALQMWQMKYRGFIMYAAANLIFLTSNLIALNIVMAVVDILFLALYYGQSKYLKK